MEESAKYFLRVLLRKYFVSKLLQEGQMLLEQSEEYLLCTSGQKWQGWKGMQILPMPAETKRQILIFKDHNFLHKSI